MDADSGSGRDGAQTPRTRPRSLQSDISALNSCKEAVSTGEEENKLSSTGMAGQWRTPSDFSSATGYLVYKRRTRPRSLQSDKSALNSCKEAVSTGGEENKLSSTGMAGQWRTSSDFSFATGYLTYKRRTRPRSLQSDISPLNSCKEAVFTGEEENKLSSTDKAGQSRTSSDFSFATENVVYKRRKLLTNNAVSFLPVENRPGCSKKTDDDCIKSSVDNSQTLLNVVPGVTPSTTIDCNDALDCVMPSISGLHHLEKPSEDFISQVIENNNLEPVQSIPPCDGVGKEPGELSLCILTKPGSAYNCGTNASSSSLRSNIGHYATSMNVEMEEGGKYSSSDGTVAELPEGFNSIKEMCISVLKNHRSLGRVPATSMCASLNNHGSLGGVSATSTCSSLKVTGAADANCSRSCKICRHSESPLKMLLCDNCEEAFHVSCSRVKVKKPTRVTELSEWYCQPCIRKNPKCLLKSSKRYISKPRIGKDYQAEVPQWTGPVSNETGYSNEPLELDPAEFLISWNISKPAVICNWLQCQEVTYEDDDDDEGTKCSKWRRAPLFEVQTEDWDCSCAVTWDPTYADCAVPQELDESIVQKHLKYVEKWRYLMAANQRARENRRRRRRRR